MAERFLTRLELYARAGGRERVQRFAPTKAGGVDETAIDAAITAAEEEAASYLSARYPTQLPATAATTPEALKIQIAQASLYHLARAGRDQVSEEIRRGYEDAVSWYRSVVAGRANLTLDATPSVDQSAPQILASKTAGDLVFGAGGLDDW